jgi:hypothetical protein
MINKGIAFDFHLFESLDEGRYECLGLGYAYSGPIYWKGEKVGEWDTENIIYGKILGNNDELLNKKMVLIDLNIMMNNALSYYSMEFIEEGKTYVLFYDPEGNLVAKREIPHQDVTEAIRLSGEDN